MLEFGLETSWSPSGQLLEGTAWPVFSPLWQGENRGVRGRVHRVPGDGHPRLRACRRDTSHLGSFVPSPPLCLWSLIFPP